MRTVDAVLFDKTGTLTTGAHAVTGVRRRRRPHRGRGAAPRRRRSRPTASTRWPGPSSPRPTRAGRASPRATDFRSLTGRGVEATVDGTALRGRRARRCCASASSTVPAELADAIAGVGGAGRRRAAPRRAATAVIGALALEDEIRPEAAAGRRRAARPRASEVVMITGDARQVADAVGRRARASTRCSPRCCPRTRTAPSPTCRPGACRSPWSATASTTPRRWPAPTSASPSAPAPTSPSSPPASCSPRSDPRGVVGVIRLSRASYRKMVQNLAWAAGYNVVAIPLAAGALAWAGITLSPAVGAVLMSAVDDRRRPQRPAAAPGRALARRLTVTAGGRSRGRAGRTAGTAGTARTGSARCAR